MVTVTAPAVRFASSSPKIRSWLAAPRRKSTRHPRAAQRVGQREQRRRAVAAADQQGPRPGRRQRERRRPSGPTTSSGSPCRAAASHSRAASVHAEHDLHSAGVGAGRGDRGSAKERRSSTPRSGPPTGSRRTARAGTARRPRRPRSRQVVRADPPAGQHLAPHLHRAAARAGALTGRPRRSCSCSSCSERTPGRPGSTPRSLHAAAMPCTVVTHGIPAATAAVRISYPSRRGPASRPRRRRVENQGHVPVGDPLHAVGPAGRAVRGSLARPRPAPRAGAAPQHGPLGGQDREAPGRPAASSGGSWPACPGWRPRRTPVPPTGSERTRPPATWRTPSERRVQPHHLAGRAHLRARARCPPRAVGAAEPVERQHRLLDRDRRSSGRSPPSPSAGSSPSARSSARLAPSVIRAAALASGTPVALDDERHRTGCPRVGFQDRHRRRPSGRTAR